MESHKETKLLTPSEVSDITGFHLVTLAGWRKNRKNLPYTTVAGKVYYLEHDVTEFMKGKRVEIEDDK